MPGVEYAGFHPALLAVERLAQTGKPAVIAIDGRCGSGKTRFALLLEQTFSCRTLHMDDFYLPLSSRAPDWMNQPGGNMDFTRFTSELLPHIQDGTALIYRPFHCQTGQLQKPVSLPANLLTVLEGSYSHHPALGLSPSLKLFLTCSQSVQTRRLMVREGNNYPSFPACWIPLEEQYFQRHNIEANSDFVIDTSDFFD